MFTITNKLGTMVAVGVAGAALACSSVASAAIVAQKPGTGTLPRPRAGQPTVVAKYIDPGKVGSAGIAGYTDAYCQQLAGHADYLMGVAAGYAISGDTRSAAKATQASDEVSNEVEDNCIVQD
jgi:hypothetical protein